MPQLDPDQLVGQIWCRIVHFRREFQKYAQTMPYGIINVKRLGGARFGHLGSIPRALLLGPQIAPKN